MKKIIESYHIEYKRYKQTLYNRLLALIALFFLPFIPTMIFYNVSLFVQILFWIFLSLLLIFVIILLGLMIYTTKRPMYELLYKDVVDEAFKDDYTHFEYEGFPSQHPFLERGGLMTKTESDVVKYRLSFYYLTNRIDLYSLYAYGNESSSAEPIFDGLYFVVHCNNHQTFKILDNENICELPQKNVVPDKMELVYQNIKNTMDGDVYLSGVDKEVHVAINYTIDHLVPNHITEEQLVQLSKDIWGLVTFGRKLYRDIENSQTS